MKELSTTKDTCPPPNHPLFVQCSAQDQPDDSDIIMLVKEYMVSKSLSQDPVAVLPARAGEGLPVDGPSLARRNPLSSDLVKEFRKSALAFAAAPWNLERTRDYLLRWIDENQNWYVHPPPAYDFKSLQQEFQLQTADEQSFIMFAPDQWRPSLKSRYRRPRPKANPRPKLPSPKQSQRTSKTKATGKSGHEEASRQRLQAPSCCPE